MEEETTPRRKRADGPMDEETLQETVRRVVGSSARFVDNELSPGRAKATDYYHAKPFGDEEDGRSQVVLSEVRDGVLGLIPSILRVVFGPERVVEFVPSTPEGVAAAEQASDYVQHVFVEENAGFLQSHAVLKDGLLKKIGIFKWGWMPGEPKAYAVDGISEEELAPLTENEAVNLTRVVETKGEDGSPAFNVEFTRADTEGKPWVRAIPPEEFIFTRETRAIDDSLFLGHRTEKSRGELIAMGIDADVLEEYGAADASLDRNVEELARETFIAGEHDPEAGEANDDILYVEGYLRIDFDGDGKAELRRICTIGPTYHVVDNVPVDDVNFSIFSPDPEPHTLLGGSWYERLKDIQRIKSALLRGALDSFSASLFPRMAYVDGRASVEDILNTEIGAPMRMDAPGMVTPFVVPFVGADAFNFLSYMDDTAEKRTGQNKGAAGLDADALQSSTKGAVNAAVTASQEHKELVTRLFCEMALKPLFRGIYRLLVSHQPKARMVRLRGQWVAINPAVWDADADVTVNVALGAGLMESKVAAFMALAGEQKEILASLGPSNPICSLAQYANTLKKAAQLSGIKDTSPYLSDVDPNWQPPPQQPPVSPEHELAQAQLQIEQMRTQKELEIKQAELQLKQAQMQLDQRQQEVEHDLAYKKLAIDYNLRREQIVAQFHADYTEADMEQDAAATQFALEHQLKSDAQAHDQAMREHEHAATVVQQAHARQMAEQQAATDAATAQAAQQQQAAPGAGE